MVGAGIKSKSGSLSGLGSVSDPDRGSALIAVIWVVGLLSLLVASFAFDAHIEARLTSYYRKRSKADYLARSGFEVARLVMVKSGKINPWEEETEEDENDPWHGDARNLAQGNTVTIVSELGEGTITVSIVTELARRNVNLLKTETEWEGILEVADVPEDMWPELIESFLDWIDPDDDALDDGAETDDYYATLDPPYKAKNGPLYTVEELLLVKGFTREILYGGPVEADSFGDEPVIISGMADLLTTFGEKKINVNAASRRVLMTLPDLGEDIDLIVDDIIGEREGDLNLDGELEPEYFKDDGDLFNRIPESGRLKEYVSTAVSKYYRITSEGEVHGVKRTIWGIVQFDGKQMKILRWREEG